MKERMISINGSRLYNCLPRIIREFEGSLEGFKCLLDSFLKIVPDRPCLPGYYTHNLDRKSNQSNCLIDWVYNMDLDKWKPDPIHENDDMLV